MLAVFRHSRGTVGRLTLRDVDEPIRMTSGHPIWSRSRRNWVVAGELNSGESVSLWKSIGTVNNFAMEAEEAPVYNLEIEGDHCYRVASSQLLVHNASPCCNSGLTNTGGSTPIVEIKYGERSVYIYGKGQPTGSDKCVDGENKHARASMNLAKVKAATGKYEYLTVNRAWSTSTGVSTDTRRPDVIGVRCDGKVDAWEIKSEGDVVKNLKDRVESGLKSLPLANRGATEVVFANC